MTGNNINHPNDFLHRWYAQELSGLLIKPKAAGTEIPVSDANVANGLSPLNWVRKAGFICSSIGGASLKVGFTGTRRVILKVDPEVITTRVASRYPILAWTANGGPLRSHQLRQGETSILLDSGTVDPVIDLYCKGFSPFENRWIGDTPANSIKITGFAVDSGGRTAAVAVPEKVWMNIGNSIESGDAALYAAGQGRPRDDAWAASDDARASYGYLLARHYGYRESRLAYGGYNWGGNAGMPRLATLIDSITSTAGRLNGNAFNPVPEIVLINLGENGVPAAGDVTGALSRLRSRVEPATKIIVMIPVSGKARAELKDAFNAYRSASNDGNAFLVDLGTLSFTTADGQHPTAEGHRTLYAAALAAFDELVPKTGLAPKVRTWVRGAIRTDGGMIRVPAHVPGLEPEGGVYLPSGKRVESG
jgi:hypothetical protein